MVGTIYQLENKKAARWLLAYPERKQAYFEMLNNVQFIGAAVNDGMPRSTEIGRPAEKKGIRLADIDKARLWLMAIEDAEKTLGEKKLAFLDIRRQAEKQKSNSPGRPGWIDYTMSRYADWHSRRYGGDYVPSYNTLRTWWQEIIDVTVRIAIRRGCL